MRTLIHGTETGYAYGCRCDDCKMARREAQQRRGGNLRIGRRAEQKRAADEALRHPCAATGCDVLVSRRATYCVEHAHDRQREKQRELQRLWLAGASLREIAAALDTTTNVVGVTMARMRRSGWDLPYRFPKQERAAK